MSAGFAEMRGYVDSSARTVRDELMTHFDVVAESLRADIHGMIDWMKANINGVTSRVDMPGLPRGGLKPNPTCSRCA